MCLFTTGSHLLEKQNHPWAHREGMRQMGLIHFSELGHSCPSPSPGPCLAWKFLLALRLAAFFALSSLKAQLEPQLLHEMLSSLPSRWHPQLKLLSASLILVAYSQSLYQHLWWVRCWRDHSSYSRQSPCLPKTWTKIPSSKQALTIEHATHRCHGNTWRYQENFPMPLNCLVQ